MMSAVPSARPDLNDRHVAVVTGASAGIGRATAVAFARKGWAVALIARSERGLNDARREVQEVGGEALVIPADVADPEAIDAASDRVAAAWGGIDVWVNNAMATVYAPVVDTTPAEFRRVTLNIVLKDEAMPSLNEQLTAQIRNLRIVEDAVAKTSEEVRKFDRESLRLEALQKQE
jgi:short-subunit dehydrogenase